MPRRLPFPGAEPSLGVHDLMLAQRFPAYLAGFHLGLLGQLFLLGTTPKCWKAPRLSLGFRSLLYLALCSGFKSRLHVPDSPPTQRWRPRLLLLNLG